MKTVIIIPSRMAATRLPGKPLLKINGQSIISHVFKRAEKANIGDVVVAAEDQVIIDDVKSNGGNAILTSKNHKTGTDRIYEALQNIDSVNIDLVMNLQGDEPLMNTNDIRKLNEQMMNGKFHLGTLASKFKDKNYNQDQNVVKVITKENFDQNQFPEAKNFTRLASSDPNTYHHLGIYCYRVETLEKFVSLNQTNNEIRDKLEQLRALDNGINVNVAKAQSAPIGVDTQDDFVAIKKIMEYKS